jgi:8-oxo-dGTP diphosphatase
MVGNSDTVYQAPPVARYALNLMQNKAGHLLLLKRSAQTRLGAGLWGLPAGKIEPGESAADAAWRELEEEIGPGHTAKLLRYLGPIRDTYYGGIYEIHLFHRRWQAGTVILNHEHTDFAWVSPEQFCNYPVMDGIDEDIALLGLWPQRYLNAARVPPALREE